MKLNTEDKLVMAHFYSLGCLNNKERAEKIRSLLDKGMTYGKLSELWNVPRNTIFGWANPSKKAVTYAEKITKNTKIDEIILFFKEDFSYIKEKHDDKVKELIDILFKLRNER